MTRIALLDYGMGNLHSAAKALEHVGAEVWVTNDANKIDAADKVVFPGVGAMRDCMQGMRDHHIDTAVRKAVTNKPVLAICVGMQALMQHSQENNGVDCLSLFEGQVLRFDNQHDNTLKVPHMGWNQVSPTDTSHPMWRNIADLSYFYFVHSYYVQPQSTDVVAAHCNYGHNFCCALSKDNVFAVQFHPEKSHHAGLQLLRNFVEWQV